MPLTIAQLQTLKSDIAANTNTVPIAGVATAINTLPQTPGSAYAIALWYSQTASPNYYVVSTNTDVNVIKNMISLAKYTPNPAPTSANAQQAAACALYAQVKLWNLDRLIGPPNTSFDATLPTNVKSLNDAVTNLPCGANFANIADAGWGSTPSAGIWSTLSRLALNIEKLFANVAGQAASALVTLLYDGTSAQGAQGNPSVMLYEGSIQEQDVLNAWAS